MQLSHNNTHVWMYPTQTPQSVTLTSPVSDSRCCCNEFPSLANLFLGPTRDRQVPHDDSGCDPDALRWTTYLVQCLSFVSVFFIYTVISCFLSPCVTDTLTHTWLSRDTISPPSTTNSATLPFHVWIWVISLLFWESAKIAWPPAIWRRRTGVDEMRRAGRRRLMLGNRSQLKLKQGELVLSPQNQSDVLLFFEINQEIEHRWDITWRDYIISSLYFTM